MTPAPSIRHLVESISARAPKTMSTLTDIDKRYLEKILDMGGGYVLDYTDATFGEFFRGHRVNIHGPKYLTYGSSKARKLRSFWEQEPDVVVGQVLSEMLDSYQADCEINGRAIDEPILARARGIADRLVGKTPKVAPSDTVDVFLGQEFSFPRVRKLPVEPAIFPIIESRLKEARKALEIGAYLSVVVLCGSILEGILLGRAQRSPALFNRSSASPKNSEGKVKRFPEWTLAQLIDVSTDVGVLKPDVQKFSHGLRDFRNYIHPYEQLASNFTPDAHTARVCFQVLKAALASVAGER